MKLTLFLITILLSAPSFSLEPLPDEAVKKILLQKQPETVDPVFGIIGKLYNQNSDWEVKEVTIKVTITHPMYQSEYSYRLELDIPPLTLTDFQYKRLFDEDKIPKTKASNESIPRYNATFTITLINAKGFRV